MTLTDNSNVVRSVARLRLPGNLASTRLSKPLNKFGNRIVTYYEGKGLGQVHFEWQSAPTSTMGERIIPIPPPVSETCK